MAPATSALAPDFVLRDVRGHNLRLSEYRGETVVISFWASWCGHCREALYLSFPMFVDAKQSVVRLYRV